MIPNPLCDAHLHLHDARMNVSMDSIKGWLKEGNALCSCATEEKSWERTIQFTQSLPHCTGAIGIHPWFCDTINVGWDTRLAERLVQNPRLVVGECGLDNHFFPQTQKLQSDLFVAQLKIAVQLNRPVVVHCLKAWQELFTIMDQLPHDLPIMIHSFSSSVEMAEQCCNRGWTLSFNTKTVHRMLNTPDKRWSKLPLTSVLVESDAPDQIPPYATTSSPQNLQRAAAELAALFNIPEEALITQIWENYCRFFQSK